jgi:hypothetical protein
MFPTRGNKGVRCQSIRGRMELTGLCVPHNAPMAAGPADRTRAVSVRRP